MYLTLELAALGYRIEVYGDPPQDDMTQGGPRDGDDGRDDCGCCEVLWFHHSQVQGNFISHHIISRYIISHQTTASHHSLANHITLKYSLATVATALFICTVSCFHITGLIPTSYILSSVRRGPPIRRVHIYTLLSCPLSPSLSYTPCFFHPPVLYSLPPVQRGPPIRRVHILAICR